MLRIENSHEEDITSQNIYETLQTAVVKAINEVLYSKDTFLSFLQGNIGFVSNKER
jgi:hypothetical protein